MSDRVCIHSDGKQNFRFSADDLVSCCWTCGMGCNGGYPGMAWRYWVRKGIVSGGSFGSNQVKTFFSLYVLTFLILIICYFLHRRI